MRNRSERPLAIASLLVCSMPAWAQISPVHVTNCGSGTFPGTVCTIPASGSGNILVIGWQMGGGINTSITIASVVDNAGNSYVEASGSRVIDAAAGSMLDIWYAKNSFPGATSVTITPSASVSNGGAVIWEFSGIDPGSPFDRASALSSQASSSIASGASVSTSAPSELVISMAGVAGNVTSLVAGNTFANDSTLKGDGWGHLLTSSAGTYTAQWNQSPSGTYASSTASFKAAGSSVISSCALNQDASVDVLDVQLAINMSLGTKACTANIEGPGVCTSDVVLRVVNASLGGPCITGLGTGTGPTHSVTLSWSPSVSPNIPGYNVYRAIVSGGQRTKLNSALVSGTAYVDTAVTPGQTYYYVATAVDNTGAESGFSNETPASVPSP